MSYKNVQKIFFTLAVLSLTKAQPVNAGLGTSLMQTARVEAPRSYEVKLHNDFIFNRGGGVNLSPHFKTGLIDGYLDLDAYFGAGKTDFQLGSRVKFNLLPDLDGQVGLAFYGGYAFLRDDLDNVHQSFHLFTTGTVISKRFEVSFGYLEPYGAFEIEFFKPRNDFTAPLTLLIGTKWEPAQTLPWAFYSEIGISIRKSTNSLSLGVSHPF